jgi:hypothetical protein
LLFLLPPPPIYIVNLRSCQSLLYDADDVAAKFLCGILLHCSEQ